MVVECAENLGDLVSARQAFGIGNEISQGQGDLANLSISFQNLSELELQAGRWRSAQEAASSALTCAELSADNEVVINSHGCLAAVLDGLGSLADARRHFAEATTRTRHPLVSDVGVWEAEFKLAVGDWAGARTQTEGNRSFCQRANWTPRLALCDILLGRCALPDDPGRAGAHLAAARDYGSRSGDVDVTLRCYHLAAEIARHERDFTRAVTEARNGIQLADSCGFGRWSLDIRTELAQIHLAAGEPAKAIEPAEWVLKRSQEEDCQYAWGVADSLHLLGVAHARIGEKQKARDYLTRATERRRLLEHPGLSKTEAELEKLGG